MLLLGIIRIANHHECKLVQLSFDFYMIEAIVDVLISIRAYESDDLDDDLCGKRSKLVSQHNKTSSNSKMHGMQEIPAYSL